MLRGHKVDIDRWVGPTTPHAGRKNDVADDEDEELRVAERNTSVTPRICRFEAISAVSLSGSIADGLGDQVTKKGAAGHSVSEGDLESSRGLIVDVDGAGNDHPIWIFWPEYAAAPQEGANGQEQCRGSHDCHGVGHSILL